MKRYHPALVSLHWLLTFMIVVALFMGSNILSQIPNDNPEKLLALKAHMITGFIILTLMIARLIVRNVTEKPPLADAGNALLNKAGVMAHYLLYLLIFAMVGSGIATALISGLPDIVFNSSGVALPEDFNDILPRIFHGVIAKILFAMIALHILASLYHQFVRKDHLLSRMWFGK
ncbi:MAG: cytochrome b/b6 domain-containing protein [Gammaproteobacteria bacterium]|nr:cytochrome b/b6 domain-containing protein [Gammaproteobacteria bacterium]